ncbi:MAG: DUF1566 domain-containing protein, partial [Thermodesulfovibrionales bacterium]
MVIGLSVSAHAALVDMNDGTIYDTDTQLSWLKNAGAGGTRQWADANTWAASLNTGGGYAGLTGWRLPNPDPTCTGLFNCINSEMGHLYYTELGNTAGGPFTNAGPFANLQANLYWTGTVYAPDPTNAWTFSFYNGGQSYNPLSQNVPYAWAVSPGARSIHLVDMNDGTIYDTDTQLSWLKDAGASGLTDWTQAVAWAASLNAGSGFAGLTGWRLPEPDLVCGNGYYNCTNSELGHLYYTELGNVAGGPMTNTAPFVNVQTNNPFISPIYWTGTEADPIDAWAFNVGVGFQAVYTKNYSANHAWAVRPGEREANLIHQYTFDSGPVAIDSIAGANGTLFGAAAIVSGALSLNGSSAYVETTGNHIV